MYSILFQVLNRSFWDIPEQNLFGSTSVHTHPSVSGIRMSNTWLPHSQDWALGAEILSGCLVWWQGQCVCTHPAGMKGRFPGDHSQRCLSQGQSRVLPRLLHSAVTQAAAVASLASHYCTPNDLWSTNTSPEHRHLGHLPAATCKNTCKTSAIFEYCNIFLGSQNTSKSTKWKLSNWKVFALWLGAHHIHKRNVPFACPGLTSAHPLHGSSPRPAEAGSPSSGAERHLTAAVSLLCEANEASVHVISEVWMHAKWARSFLLT